MPAAAPMSDGTALAMVPVGRRTAAIAPTRPKAAIAPAAVRGWCRDRTPTASASRAIVAEIPPSRAILSFAPKVAIANDLSHSGVRSMNVLPTASRGDAEGPVRLATRCPMARAVAAARRPITADATTRPRGPNAGRSAGRRLESMVFTNLGARSDRLRITRGGRTGAFEQTTMGPIQPSPRRRGPMSIGDRSLGIRSCSARRPSSRSDGCLEHLGGAAVWAKRDDCNSGIAFGGNKTRKLEYLVADALATGCDTLVSIGGVQSNHTRQVAAVAAHVGLGCVLIQESWVDWPDPVYDRVGNILISRLVGADVRLVQAGFGIGFKESWEAGAGRGPVTRRQAVRDPGRRLRSPAGRSRLRELGVRGRRPGARARRLLRHVIVCSVTGSTQAGMIAGAAALADAGGRRPSDHRDRRLREARRDPRAGGPDRSSDGVLDRPGARPARGRDRTRRAVPRRDVRDPG